MAENGVWRTIRGRHVFIRNGEDLAKAMKRKKEWLENNRTKIRNKIVDAKEGYKKRNELSEEDIEWRYGENPQYGHVAYRDYESGKYVADKSLNLTKDLNKAYTIKDDDYDKKDKIYDDYEKKTGKYGLDQVRIKKDKNGNNIEFDKYLEEEREKADTKINNLPANLFRKDGRAEFNKNYIDAEIDDKKLYDLQEKLHTALRGNSKSAYNRSQKLDEIVKDLDNYYKKHPVTVSNTEFKTFNKPMMKDALNELYMQGIVSEDNEQYFNNIMKGDLGKGKIGTPGERAYFKGEKQSLQNALNNSGYKKTIYNLNQRRRTFGGSDKYIAEMDYDPYNFLGDDTYFDKSNFDMVVYNVWRNKKSESDYPLIEETSNWRTNGDKKKYGIGTYSESNMTPKEAKEMASNLNIASDFVEKINKDGFKEYYKSDIELQNLSQAQRMFEQQGYSPATAKKMALEYLKNRKRK